MNDVLNALNDLCEAISDFAYFSELPKAKELRRAAEHLQEMIAAAPVVLPAEESLPAVGNLEKFRVGGSRDPQRGREAVISPGS